MKTQTDISRGDLDDRKPRRRGKGGKKKKRTEVQATFESQSNSINICYSKFNTDWGYSRFL